MFARVIWRWTNKYIFQAGISLLSDPIILSRGKKPCKSWIDHVQQINQDNSYWLELNDLSTFINLPFISKASLT